MANTYTKLLYHLVFSTKRREPLITSDFQKDLYSYMAGIAQREGAKAFEIGGMPDHIHLVIQTGTEPSLAQIAKVVKAKSSKWLNERVNKRGYFAWQTGYGAFTVSESQFARVRTYVRRQEQHHRRLSYQDEFRGLLIKHGIEFDERYLWD